MNDERDRMTPAPPGQEGTRGPTQRQATEDEEQASAPRPAGNHAGRGGGGATGAKTGDKRATGTTVNGAAGGDAAQKKAKQKKPTFPEFIELAKQAIGATPSLLGLKSLQKLLKTGVSGKSSPVPLINELFALLKDWPECSRLALQLSVQTRAQRSSELIRGLRDRLIAHSRSVVGYPEAPQSSGADHEQLAVALSEWLERHLNDCWGAGKDRKAGELDLNWARWAAVCLMEEPLFLRTEGIYRLLETLCPNHPPFDPQVADTFFFSEVGSLLERDKLNSRKVVTGLKFASGARSLGAATRSQLGAARDTISRQNARLDELDGKVKTLSDMLANATARIADLESQVLQKTQQVEQEKKERYLDKEHWETLSEQQLTRKMNEISERLAHEISEAKICLSDDAPNVRMALGRLREMEKALAKMKGF